MGYNFDDLPPEILRQIIEYCAFVRFEDFHNVASINRSMFMLLRIQQEGIKIDNRAFLNYKKRRSIGIEVEDYVDFKKCRRIEERHFRFFRFFGILTFFSSLPMTYLFHLTFSSLAVFTIIVSCMKMMVPIYLFTIMSIFVHFTSASFFIEFVFREVNIYYLKRLKRDHKNYQGRSNFFYPRGPISFISSISLTLLNRYVLPAINDENFWGGDSNVFLYLPLLSILPLLYYNFKQLNTESMNLMRSFHYKRIGPILLTSYEAVYLFYAGRYFKYEHPNPRKQKMLGIVSFPIFAVYTIFSLSRVKYMIDILLHKYQLQKTVFFIYFIRIFIPFVIGWLLWSTVFLSNMIHPLSYCMFFILLHFLFNPLMYVTFNPDGVKFYRGFLRKKFSHNMYRKLFLPNSKSISKENIRMSRRINPNFFFPDREFM